ncbi:cell division protein FtsQ/DivIB [Prochlorococcus sp. MIT 1341]|uniref:cell division protein FtsQ/DivIB n=1 Tax=Prochlorococcus sp. MIT 1341 TaxID=3096221 RepID=UPI002A7640FD|nr:FtsQ-type POTRA domain-containing protein [Prochlorococcus sp. MIT 1341]
MRRAKKLIKHSQSFKGDKEQENELRKNLKVLWSVFVYTGSSCSILWLLIMNGWSPIYSEQIQVKGTKNIDLGTIINMSGLQLPQRILSLSPNDLEKKLKTVLPIKKAIVHRRLIPPGLEILITEKQPIAYGMRRKGKTIEKGMVDINGEWIPIKFLGKVNPPATQLSIEGWMPSHKQRLSIVLKHRNHLGSSLKKIIISPNGEMTLKTKELGLIELGFDSPRLLTKLKATAHLNRNLPTKFRNKPGMIVDMRDPSKPELQFTGPTR